MSLRSAGILSPYFTSTISPGTRSLAFIYYQFPSLKTKAWGDYRSFNASIAFSASKSYQIPTTALQIKMVKMTQGSTQGGIECSSVCPSK